MTAAAMKGDRKRAIDSGMDHISKPFDMNAFQQLLAQYNKLRKTDRSLPPPVKRVCLD